MNQLSVLTLLKFPVPIYIKNIKLDPTLQIPIAHLEQLKEYSSDIILEYTYSRRFWTLTLTG